MENPSPIPEIESTTRYFYEYKAYSNGKMGSYDSDIMVDKNVDRIGGRKSTKDYYTQSCRNLNYVYKNTNTSTRPPKATVILSPGRTNCEYANWMTSDPSHRSLGKKYAVVVGINEYSDRSSLHTCINDANAIAETFKESGYEVIELTDETNIKPTKHNILEGALAEIDMKNDRENVVFYFSGHSELDDRGDFYLIPQDANGNPNSYIRDAELSKHIQGLKNLAVIIDACNSGGFKYEAEPKQIILTSSKDDEPSNEDWLGSFSVFTYQLCKAIKQKRAQGGSVSLQSCFYTARDDTILWSSSHLLSQTPKIIDMTYGRIFTI